MNSQDLTVPPISTKTQSRFTQFFEEQARDKAHAADQERETVQNDSTDSLVGKAPPAPDLKSNLRSDSDSNDSQDDSTSALSCDQGISRQKKATYRPPFLREDMRRRDSSSSTTSEQGELDTGRSEKPVSQRYVRPNMGEYVDDPNNLRPTRNNRELYWQFCRSRTDDSHKTQANWRDIQPLKNPLWRDRLPTIPAVLAPNGADTSKSKTLIDRTSAPRWGRDSISASEQSESSSTAPSSPASTVKISVDIVTNKKPGFASVNSFDSLSVDGHSDDESEDSSDEKGSDL